MLVAAYFLTSFVQGPKDDLNRLADKLAGLKRVSFSYRRDLNYQSDGYKHTLTAEMYVEFGRAWQPLRARYMATFPDGAEAFDGQSYWRRGKGKETENMFEPKAAYLDSLSVLKNSLIGLSYSLSAVAKEEGIALNVAKDSAGNSKISFELKGKELGITSPLSPVQITPRYEITVDAKSGLPTKIVEFLKNRNDTITTTFTNYNLAPKEPDSWNP